MNHAPNDSSGLGRGTFRSYSTGFILSLVLTAIPFVLVMKGMLSQHATLIAIFSAATAQILVHLYYFLHLDASSKARWNVLSMLFAALIMLLIVGGSIWIMYNLNYRMM
jgi:cytochrome o ubiquinol oxidase operon protein cyoD